MINKTRKLDVIKINNQTHFNLLLLSFYLSIEDIFIISFI